LQLSPPILTGSLIRWMGFCWAFVHSSNPPASEHPHRHPHSHFRVAWWNSRGVRMAPV